MSTRKARCPVCGRLQFRLIPGSQCYCACGTRFLVGSAGDEASLQVLQVPSHRSRPEPGIVVRMKEPGERPTRKTNRFT
ncbi:MAG: hypothetical protein EHM23_28000 [Acidobacteria bacterium]|nr:MAG: hypothetical protein EHM23_28000 [Acidobacteriota bacterium]